MRDLPDTRVGPTRAVGDPPHEALWSALERARRALGLPAHAEDERDAGTYEETRDAA